MSIYFWEGLTQSHGEALNFANEETIVNDQTSPGQTS